MVTAPVNGTAYAVTLGGYGDVWLFASQREAWLHPIVQHGDPVIPDGDDFRRHMGAHLWPNLCRFLGRTPRETEARNVLEELSTLGSRQANTAFSRVSSDVWMAIRRAAKPPPESYEAVVSIVAKDRELFLSRATRRNTMTNTNHEHSHVGHVDHTEHSDAGTEAKTEAKTEAAPAAVAAASRTKLNRSSKIKVLVDKNPKRVGSKSFDRFEIYTKHPTVGGYLDNGGYPEDIAYDRNKNFIEVVDVAEVVGEKQAA